MEITLLTAFLGGVLALLSPCGALLLPAFFASSLGNRLKILLHGGIFYLGLALTLVPLGLGLGALGTLVTSYREVMIMVTSAILVLLGIAQALGFGFDLAKHLPGASGLQQKAHNRSGALRTFLLGAASGVAGFCAGPILGAILTLAMAQGDTLRAGFMLAVYGAGMVVPLIGLAAIWTRLGPRAMKVLRGRGFSVFGKQLHTTSVITGLLIAGVGVLFWTTNGLVSAPSLLPTEIDRWMQSHSGLLASPTANAIAVGVIAVVIILIWALRQRKQYRRRIHEQQVRT